MDIAAIVAGVVLLLFGRRLFWFFVAAAGFVAGIYLARDQFQVHSQTLLLAIALLAGVIGALLSVLIQKLAVALAGFAAGGYLGAILVQSFNAPNYAWVGFVIGGIIGAVLMLVLFNWALIILSALLGASLLADSAAPKEWFTLVFLAAFVIGVIVQAFQLRRSPAVEQCESQEKRAA
jgi:hypothetical protein